MIASEAGFGSFNISITLSCLIVSLVMRKLSRDSTVSRFIGSVKRTEIAAFGSTFLPKLIDPFGPRTGGAGSMDKKLLIRSESLTLVIEPEYCSL